MGDLCQVNSHGTGEPLAQCQDKALVRKILVLPYQPFRQIAFRRYGVETDLPSAFAVSQIGNSKVQCRFNFALLVLPLFQTDAIRLKYPNSDAGILLDLFLTEQIGCFPGTVCQADPLEFFLSGLSVHGIKQQHQQRTAPNNQIEQQQVMEDCQHDRRGQGNCPGKCLGICLLACNPYHTYEIENNEGQFAGKIGDAIGSGGKTPPEPTAD